MFFNKSQIFNFSGYVSKKFVGIPYTRPNYAQRLKIRQKSIHSLISKSYEIFINSGMIIA
jgi:hypothetical protein